MITALWLLAAQGVIGAFDTLYFHEWRARLPAGVPATSPELKIHAWRDVFYAVLFGSLPWIKWQGLWTLILGFVIVVEIILTMWDFIVEIRARRFLGDVYGGERLTHAAMGIIYGAMIANLLPTLVSWGHLPSGLVPHASGVPLVLRWALSLMAIGVFLSGMRDLYAAFELPGGSWPWRGKTCTTPK
jgi:hypothetical protein